MKTCLSIKRAKAYAFASEYAGCCAVMVVLMLLAGCATAVTQDQADPSREEAPSAVVAGEANGAGVAEEAAAPVPVLPPADASGYAEAVRPESEKPVSKAQDDSGVFTPEAPRLTYTSVRVPGPYVAMTFDDGPHPQLTPRLLDMLKERGIKATFYLVGQNVAQYPEIVARMVAEGHEVGNHSWSHPFFTKMSETAVRSQLQRTHDAIVSASGVAPKTLRPPYGAITSSQKQWIAADYGYPTVLWSVDPMDWKNRDASLVSRRIVNGASQGAIILAHDIHKSTVDAMPTALDTLLAQGYKFETVSQLIRRSQAPVAPEPVAADPAAAPVSSHVSAQERRPGA